MEQLEVDDVEKELETERIEESMKEAERQEEGEAAAEVEEERFVLPEAEGQSLQNDSFYSKKMCLQKCLYTNTLLFHYLPFPQVLRNVKHQLHL